MERINTFFAKIIISMAAIICAAMLICSCGEAKTEDGNYTIEVGLEGGSGRASVTSPCSITVNGDESLAYIEWSSPYYDYMIVGEETLYPVNEDGNSVFEVPLETGRESLEVVADTTAMSQPYEISYVLSFDWSTLEKDEEKDAHTGGEEVELSYAEGYSAIKYDDGCYLVTIGDEKYHIKAEGCTCEEDAVVINKGCENIYAASSSVLDLIRGIGALGSVKSVSVDASDWYIDEVKSLVENGDIKYVGKYSAPDYEMLLNLGTDFAVENTMIYHSPEIKEEIEELGIPVLVEMSSYEAHPLGRLEWIKLYGMLLGKEDEAESFFDEEVKKVENLEIDETETKTVAFFYVTSSGQVNVRKTGDYIPKMIEMAGGNYVLKDTGDDENALSTMNMDLESFYTAAKDADIIIYNSTVTGDLESIDDLIAKSDVFEDFKAVKEGNVWCMSASTFQQTTAICELIKEFNEVLRGSGEDLEFLKKTD